MLAESKYSLVYRNHLEMRVSEPLSDRQADVMSVRANLGAMLMIVGRALSAIAAGRVTHMDVGSAASPSGTGAALLQGGGGAILVRPLFPRVCNTHAQMSAR